MPGYKQTEVGMIPEDWEVKSVHEFAAIKTGPFGTLLKAAEYSEGDGVPLISVGEIREGFLKITDHTPRVPEAVVRRLPQYVLKKGDIVFGRKGGVERSALIREEQDGWFLGSDGISIRPSKQCHSEYLALQFQSNRVQDWLIQNAIGTTMASLNQEILKKVAIPIPPIQAEQVAIAEVLSKADALIDPLEQLIAKKRLLKRGVMQELLSGKKRLSRFGGKWMTGVLSDCFELVSTRNAELNDNVVTISAQLGFVRQEEFFKKRVASRALGNYYLIKRGQFAYNRSYSYGYPFGAIKRLTKFDKAVVTTLYICFALKPDVEADPDFFEHYFEAGLLNAGLSAVASEGGRAHGLLNITKADFLSRELKFPSLPEQSAIAAIISAMDTEITLLETQLAKYRQLKQGLMQKLLTGRIRLI
jgi:type I restriction enzyme, S subunit